MGLFKLDPEKQCRQRLGDDQYDAMLLAIGKPLTLEVCARGAKDTKQLAEDVKAITNDHAVLSDAVGPELTGLILERRLKNRPPQEPFEMEEFSGEEFGNWIRHVSVPADKQKQLASVAQMVQEKWPSAQALDTLLRFADELVGAAHDEIMGIAKLMSSDIGGVSLSKGRKSFVARVAEKMRKPQDDLPLAWAESRARRTARKELEQADNRAALLEEDSKGEKNLQPVEHQHMGKPGSFTWAWAKKASKPQKTKATAEPATPTYWGRLMGGEPITDEQIKKMGRSQIPATIAAIVGSIYKEK